MNKNLKLTTTFLIILIAVAVSYFIFTKPQTSNQDILYMNKTYGFDFTLPKSWAGYSIIIDKWIGNPIGGATIYTTGPEVLIRNPKWTKENPYQDISIMVFTLGQWSDLQSEKFHIGAAPIGPSEFGRNSKYIFALPARYNYAFPTGYEEVDKIIQSKPLSAF